MHGESPSRTGKARVALIDLSHAVEHAMPVYPGDPPVAIGPALTLDADGVAVTALHLGSHTGTHVDAPSHTIAGGRTMADVGLDELYGEAIVLRVREAGEAEVLGWERLDPSGELPEILPPIVLIDTGWARLFRDEGRTRHPALSSAAAGELLRRGMRVLAVDTLSPDLTDPEPAEFPVHEVVLGSNALVVENVRGLEHVPDRVRVGFFPLRLAGDGSPVRGVAFLDRG
ncbi:cyclase family protein [Microbacterium insulae]|uniref:Cyclase family protein n=1 Tax=Microbacterium insulae TaxID=483014 RepID=A0ABW3AJT6_9MICO